MLTVSISFYLYIAVAEDEHFSYGKTKGDGTSFGVILFFSRDVFLGHGHVCLADLYPTLPMNVLN